MPDRTASPFHDLPTLETERLLLRPFRMVDAQDVFAYASRPELTEYLPWLTHRSIADSREYLRFVEERRRRGEPASWGMELREEGRIVGSCGFNSWEPGHARAEIGYCLSPDYRGLGLMPEAVRAVLKFGFEALELNRIAALCQVENVASERVLEKVGMRCEGVHRQHHWMKDSFRDMNCYALLREEWQQMSLLGE